MSKRFAGVLVLTSMSAPALAGGDGDLWTGPVAIVCVEQDRSYGATWYGRQMVDGPSYQGWRTTQGVPLLACVAMKKQPEVPTALCDELFKQTAASTPLDMHAL